MRLIKSKSTVFLCSLVIWTIQVFGQKDEKLIFDTSTITVIPFNNIGNWPFYNNYKASALTQRDIILIEAIFEKAVNDYNNGFDSLHVGQKINITFFKYKRQIVAATNSKGEKDVWINVFCEAHGFPWKTNIMQVDDGGSCYFNLKINLALKKSYDFWVNGEA
jgi:hypothetical protein